MTSCKLEYVNDEKKENKGYGFVSYEKSESGKEAVEKLNGTKHGEHTLYVGRFEKKSERSKKLKLEMNKGNSEKNMNKNNL